MRFPPSHLNRIWGGLAKRRQWAIGSLLVSLWLIAAWAGTGTMAIASPNPVAFLPSIATVRSLQPQAIAQAPDTTVTVYRDPSCHCCGRWIEHMQAEGFQVEDHLMDDMTAIKQTHQVPTDLASCHTAIVNGYVVEGHVPAADIQRLLQERPDVAGIVVPDMPAGSPGMETESAHDPFTVLLFDQQGNTEQFNEYSF